jgi:hypothetical protein
MNYFKFGVRVSISFLIIGTVILIWFYFSMSSKIVRLGYLFTVLALFIAWAYTAFLLFHFVRQKLSLTELFKTIGILFINIPIGLAYIYLVMFLLNHVRITVKNSAASDIMVLSLTGCEEKKLKALKNGDAKTVWIRITGDCAINIEYEVNGIEKKKTLIEYITPGGGVRATYEIKE